MNDYANCPHEHRIAMMIAAGESLPLPLREHVQNCPDCGAAEEVARELRLLSTSALDRPLPSASLVLWRAKLAERQKAIGTINDVLIWSGRLGLACGFLAIAVLASVLSKAHAESVGFWIGGLGLTGILAIGTICLGIWHACDDWSAAREGSGPD